MPGIIPLNPTFNVRALLETLPDFVFTDQFFETGQLAITHSEDSDSWYDGNGTLTEPLKNSFRQTSDYVILNKHFHGTYMEEVIEAVRKQAKIDRTNIGRVRLLYLKPKSCYTLHRDPEDFRYHIPLMTNPKCFFVLGQNVERMPEMGRLYRFRTKEDHTAINASLEHRFHLVFDTF